MDSYTLVKTLHILSAVILFGTGLGTAFVFWSARKAEDAVRLYAARTTIRADFIFTLPAVIVQPLSGAWLVSRGGFDWTDFWLVGAYSLYAIAGLGRLPVVWLQMRMGDMMAAKVEGEPFHAARYELLRRIWFALGWPAFLGLVAAFYLMVAKPTW